jgi:ketosteroid isomerase-like protein
MGAHQPIATGREAIAAAWKALMELPGVSARWQSTEVRVASSGEVAYELGTYMLSYDSEQDRVRDIGKYLVIWRKESGGWMIAVDMINSDLSPGA